MSARGTGAAWQVPGRTRLRLAKLLEGEGFSNVSLRAAQGRERSDPREDIFRWEGNADRDGVSCWLTSWDTMSNCVRRGIVVERDGPSQYDVSARAPAPSGHGLAVRHEHCD